MKKETVKIKKPKAPAQKVSAEEIIAIKEMPNEEIVIIEKTKDVEVAETYRYKGEKVGDILRKKRLELGKKIPEVAKILCIRRVYLEAIESSNYAEIPEFPYGPGFIRSYAEFLGLGSNQLVNLFKLETDTKNSGHHISLEPAPDISTPNRKYLVISIISILVLYFAWFLYRSVTENSEETSYNETIIETSSNDMGEFSIQVEDYANINTESSVEGMDSSTPIPTVEEENKLGTSPSVEQETITPPENTAATVEEPKEIIIPAKGIFLVAKKEVWVEVRSYDKLYLSKILQPGDTYLVPNKEDMILSAGHPNGLEVFVNGTLTQVVTPQKKMNIDLNDFKNR